MRSFNQKSVLKSYYFLKNHVKKDYFMKRQKVKTAKQRHLQIVALQQNFVYNKLKISFSPVFMGLFIFMRTIFVLNF